MGCDASKPLVTARDVDRLPRGATLEIADGAIVTPWARDRAAARGVAIRRAGMAPFASPAPSDPAPVAAAGAACGCSAPASPAPPSPRAPQSPPAAPWISPFANRMLRGPDVSVLLGAQAVLSSY